MSKTIDRFYGSTIPPAILGNPFLLVTYLGPEGGATRDLAFAYAEQPQVVFDFCRSQKEFVNYHIIEAFKNGRLFSSKYESSLRIFDSCKVVCFANFLPEFSKLSLDRWMCLELTNEKFSIVYPE